MGFSPSPQPLATKSRNHDSNDHHADHHVAAAAAAAAAATTPAATTATATASTGQTPDLLAAIARRLGMDIGALAAADRNVEGVVEMMKESMRRTQTKRLLCTCR